MSLEETAYTSAGVSTGCEEWAPISRDGAPPRDVFAGGLPSANGRILHPNGLKFTWHEKLNEHKVLRSIAFKVVMLALVVINNVTWSQSVWLFVGVHNALARNHILKMLRILVIVVEATVFGG